MTRRLRFLPLLVLVSIGAVLVPPTATADPAVVHQPLDFTRSGYDYAPTVLWDGRQWVLYACGLVSDDLAYNSDGIVRSTSPDGVTWSEPEPVLFVGPAGSWDERHVCDPTVIKGMDVEGHQWAMWYTGVSDRSNLGPGPNRIGLAVSHDGITWTKSKANPVIDCGSDPQYYGCLQPSVVRSGDTFFMSHTSYLCNDASCRQNVVQTSSDGVRWTRGREFTMPQLQVGPDFVLGNDGTWYSVIQGDTTCGRTPGYASELAVYASRTMADAGTGTLVGCIANDQLPAGTRFLSEGGFYRDGLGRRLDGSALWMAFGTSDTELHAMSEDIEAVRITSGSPPERVHRIAGSDRVQTAAALSRTTFVRSSTAVLARADAYADALTGGPLAAAVGGPVLLTNPRRLDVAARAELARLGVMRVVVLGGSAAIAPEVDVDLRAAGVTDVTRVAGSNRFDTARLVAERIGGTDVYVVQGSGVDPQRGWPDAVAVSPLAGWQRRPILLVDGERVPDETRASMRALSATSATIVGGSAVVSDATAAALGEGGAQVHRIAGTNRYETAVAVADTALANGVPGTVAWITTGRNWPDSLVAGPVAAAGGGVVLLMEADEQTSAPARQWLSARRATTRAAHLVGGTAALPPGAELYVAAAMGV